MENSPPIVFISYAHEDDLSSKVKSLADWLISNGVQVITDHPYVNRPPEQGWRAWMQHSVEDADYVLIVCTHRYKKLFERRTEKIDHGYGVTWESAIITVDIYQSRLKNTRFFPILPDGGSHEDVPSILMDWHNNHRFPSGNKRILSLVTEEIVIPAPANDSNSRSVRDDEVNKTESITMSSNFFGERRKEIFIDLIENWKIQGPAVSVIQGFPGTGKSQLAAEVASHFSHSLPFIEPPTESSSYEKDLLIDLATLFDDEGISDVSRELNKGIKGDPFGALFQIIRQIPLILVIDEFQRTFEGASTIPPLSWRRFIERVNNSPKPKGRIILISNRMISEDRWCESSKSIVLKGLTDSEAGEFFYKSLSSMGIPEKVPKDRLNEIGHRLGGNPRAIKTLVAGLISESLDDLLYFCPNTLESVDMKIDPLLLEKFERGVIQRTLSNIDSELLDLLRFLSVHRRPFGKSAIFEYGNNKVDINSFRQQLIDRFLISNSLVGDELHPLAREVSVSRLAEQQDKSIEAHNAAANYNLSKFSISRKKGIEKIASSYAELRHHLHQSGRGDELAKVNERLINFALSDIDKPAQSKIPENSETLEERITLLSALPNELLTKGLEFHLALCLKHRNVGDDYRKALFHIRNAVGRHAYYAAWLLLIDLEYEINGIDAMIEAQKKAIRFLKGGNNSFSIFHHCSNILSKENRLEEAIKLLKEGIETPNITCLSPLVSLCADLMQEAGKIHDAINLIKHHLDRDLPEVSILYKRCADLMYSSGQKEEAIILLKEAISKPGMTKVYSIYLMCSDLLEKSKRANEAITLLKEGIKDNNVEDPVELYRKISDMLIDQGQSEEAIEIIQSGITNHTIKSPEKFYIYYSELLEQLGRRNDASSQLRQYLSRASNPSSFIYLSCAKILFHMRDLDGAIEILSEGISKSKLKDRQQLIRMCADLLYRKGEISEGIEVLKRGIEDPAVNNKYALYRLYSDISVKENQLQEAIDILKCGINAPAVENKTVLVQSCAKLLERNGRRDEAVTLIKKAINKPGMTGLVPLYQLYAKIMEREGNKKGAIQLLQDAIKGPKLGNLVSLYQLCAEIMLKDDQNEEAKEILSEGVAVFPKDKNLAMLYSKLKGS